MAQTNTSSYTNSLSSVTNSLVTASTASVNNMMSEITRSATDAITKRVNDTMAAIFGDTDINGKVYIKREDFSSDFINTIQTLALNSGDAFLNGLDTSAFAPPDETRVEDAMRFADRAAKDMSTAIMETGDTEAAAKGFASNMLMSTGIGGQVTAVSSMVNMVTDTNWDVVGEQAVRFTAEAPKIIAEVTAKAVVNVTKKLTIYTASRLTEILDPTVLAVATSYYTTYYTGMAIKDASYLIKDVLMNKEDLFAQKQAEMQKIEKTEKEKKLQEKIASIKEKTTTTIDTIKSGIEATKPYIRQGVDPFIKMGNSYIRKEVDKAIEYIDNEANLVIDLRNDYIKDIGEKAGTAIGEALNESTKKLLKKQHEKAKKEITTASYKAIQAIMTPTQIMVANVGPVLGKMIKKGVQSGLKLLIQQAQQAIATATQKALNI